MTYSCNQHFRTVALIFLIAMIFASVHADQGSGSISASADAKRKDLIALVPRNWPPQYQTDDNGKPFGFAIDIMNEVAEIAGYSVTYRSYPNFSEVVDALRAKEGDLIPNSGILLDRLGEFVFTSPVETFKVSIFVRDDEDSISSLEDLSGKTVSVVEKNVGLFMLRNRDDMRLKVQHDLQDAIMTLISGNSDALVYPASVAISMARSAGISDRLKVVGKPLREVKRGIRLRIADKAIRDDLDLAVNTLLVSDRYKKIYQRWYGKKAPLLSTRQIAVLFSSLLILTIGAMFFWRHLSLQRMNRSLAIKVEDRTHDLSEALKDKEVLVQEIHHRVKNNLQVILSMLSLQKRNAVSPHEIDSITESSRRIRVMAKLYERLYQSDQVAKINAAKYLNDVFDDALTSGASSTQIKTEFSSDDVTFDIKTATACAQLLSELVSNSLKHAFPSGEGRLTASLRRLTDGQLRLRVEDNGIGLPKDFDESKLKSMGFKLINALVSQLGGRKHVKSLAGTCIDVEF